MDKFDYYFRVLGRYDQYVQLANTKASNQLTLLSSLLVAVTAIAGWGIPIKDWNYLTVVIGVLYLIFLAYCCNWHTACIAVLDPDRSRNKENTAHKIEDNSATNNSKAHVPSKVEDKLSTIFYSDVAQNKNFGEFKNKVDKKSDVEEFEDLLHQVFIMAGITERKFNAYQEINKNVNIVILISLMILIFSFIAKFNG